MRVNIWTKKELHYLKSSYGQILINGPCKIKGTIKLSGSKNASLPILAATILFDEPVEIKNLPNVKDISTMLDLIKSLGFSVQKNKLKIL